MNRTDRSTAKRQELFGNLSADADNFDPEFAQIADKFIYGEIFYQGNLDTPLRVLISLVALATIRDRDYLELQTQAALNIGLDPHTLKEALYQCAPFIGFPAISAALQIVNNVLSAHHITLPLEARGTVTEEDRFEAGRSIQFPIYGERMKQNLSSLPEEHRSILPRYLTEMCFGDFYTRPGLDLKTRELLILCALCALGGTEAQIKSHAAGNLKVGNDRETILSAITQCLPWVGFPRVLNAINIIKEINLE